MVAVSYAGLVKIVAQDSMALISGPMPSQVFNAIGKLRAARPNSRMP